MLSDVHTTLPDEKEVRSQLTIRPHATSGDHFEVTGVKDDLLSQHTYSPHKSWLVNTFRENRSSSEIARDLLGSVGTCMIGYLSAEARFQLTKSSEAYNPREEVPSNGIQSLFSSTTETHNKLRNAFKTAFQMDIGLDWAGMTRWYLRVAANFGNIPSDKDALDNLMASAQQLEKQGDGFRSFAGIALSLLTYPTRPILLDEPEAFLHPAQARVLGRWVVQQASERAGQVIVATHSADFLAGLLSEPSDAQLLRLTRTSAGTRFHVVAPSVITSLVESPLLSSQPVLDSLFHRGVVICEGDPDRAIYQTVTQRHLTSADRGDILFIHSNGKDAARQPADLLRLCDTPVCVIVDFDVLNSEEVLDGLVRSLHDQPASSHIKSLRKSIASAIEASVNLDPMADLVNEVESWLKSPGVDVRRARRRLVAAARAGSNKWDAVKKKGVSALPEPHRSVAVALIDELATLGLFVVPCGELESWMTLPSTKGAKWNQLALQDLYAGRCPESLKIFVESVVGQLTRRK